jgi:quercetin dioxygenase-like cupin family protein
MRGHSQLEPSSLSKSTGPFASGFFIDLNEQIEQVFRDLSVKDESGRKTKMLIKHDEFRIALVTMRSGSRWSDHKTPARIAVQVLRGQLRFNAPEEKFELASGQLLTLDPGVIHSVEAAADSAFLLMLSDPRRP